MKLIILFCLCLMPLLKASAEVRCPEGMKSESIIDFLQERLGGVQISAFNTMKPISKQVSLSYNQDRRNMAEYLPLINSSFQIYKLAELDSDITDQTLPVGHQDNPYDRPLIPICSGSFLNATRFRTAHHCLRSKTGAREDIHILRRHNFVQRGTGVVRRSYTDTRILSGSVENYGDFLSGELASSVPPPYLANEANSEIGLHELIAIGYPSSGHGNVVLTLGCSRPSANTYGQLVSRKCPVEGGMSGGPVVSTNQRFVGVVSESDSDGTTLSIAPVN